MEVVIAICKDTKLKAIHNTQSSAQYVPYVVIAICKDTKLKAIHNNPFMFINRVIVVIAICKDTKNLRNNGRMRVNFDKWLVQIPFLCYPAIFLISAEIAVYGGY